LSSDFITAKPKHITARVLVLGFWCLEISMLFCTSLLLSASSLADSASSRYRAILRWPVHLSSAMRLDYADENWGDRFSLHLSSRKLLFQSQWSNWPIVNDQIGESTNCNCCSIVGIVCSSFASLVSVPALARSPRCYGLVDDVYFLSRIFLAGK
jgi:hypothetical protein